jgi:hypothetical protein
MTPNPRQGSGFLLAGAGRDGSPGAAGGLSRRPAWAGARTVCPILADHAGLLVAAGVAGAAGREVPQGGEPGLDPA